MFVDGQTLNSADQGSTLLFLVWDELFDPYSLDSFQPKFHHVFSLCRELLDVAAQAKTSEHWKKHLPDVQDELRAMLLHEESFLSKMQFERWEVNELTRITDPHDLHLACRVVLSKWKDFEATALNELREAVTELPKEKERTISALKRVATCALWSGRSPAEIRMYLPVESLLKDPATIIDDLQSHLKIENLPFQCALKMVGPEPSIKSVVRVQGFNLIAKDEKENIIQCTGKSWSLDDVMVQVGVEAGSPMMAAMIAISKIGPAINTLNFYENKRDIVISGTVAVRQPSGEWSAVNAEDQSLRKLHPRKMARTFTKNILQNIDEQRLQGSLLNALELHSLFHGTAEPRVRLINLWAALECLIESSRGKNILTKVVKSVAPIMTWRRADRVLRYLAIYLHKWWLANPSRHPGKRFPTGTAKTIQPELLFLVLARKKDDPEIIELLSFADGHPLLVNRIFTLWKILHDPQMLLKELLASEKRIDWHLQRIYRARNLAVHAGRNSSGISQLLDNLHYYFSVTLSRILDEMHRNPDWGINEALLSCQYRYKYLIARLKTNPEQLRISDFFPHPDVEGKATLWQ